MSMNLYPNNPLMVGQANFNPYLSQIPVNPVIPNYQPVVSAQGPHMEINRVNGVESVYAFPMGANSSVILVDNTKPKIWLVTTDSSGFKDVHGFKITPDDDEIKESAPVQETPKEDPLKAINERLDKLEERMSTYGQSNNRSSWQSKSSNGNAQPNDRSSSGSKGSNGSNQSDGRE